MHDIRAVHTSCCPLCLMDTFQRYVHRFLPESKMETEVTGNAILLNAQLKVSQTGKKINVAWGKVAAADGYDVYVQYCGKSFTKKSITAIKGREVTEVVVKKSMENR